MEKWKNIFEYTDYIISTNGNIVSKKRKDKIFLKKRINKRKEISSKYLPYQMVVLYSNGIPKSKFVHRLVAQTFISNPENKPCVNHIDNNVQNNKIENLEWVTHSENRFHCEKTIKLNQDQIKCVLFKHNLGYSQRMLAKEFGTTRGLILNIIKKQKTK